MKAESNIAIIVVLYHATKKQIEVFNTLSECYVVIAVDNSPDDNSCFMKGCEYIPLYSNKGIAAAQNIGIEKCKQLGIQDIVFFDQDSDVCSDMVSNLVESFHKVSQSDPNIAALAPTIVNNRRTDSAYPIGIKNEFTLVSSVISSGTTTSLQVIEDVGMMAEDLFIDYVDFEWCWRASSKGYHLYRAKGIMLPHTVGVADTSFLGYPFIISSPERYYYKYRNIILLSKRKYIPAIWKIKSVIRLTATLIHILLSGYYTGKRKECLTFATKGLREGLKALFIS